MGAASTFTGVASGSSPPPEHCSCTSTGGSGGGSGSWAWTALVECIATTTIRPQTITNSSRSGGGLKYRVMECPRHYPAKSGEGGRAAKLEPSAPSGAGSAVVDPAGGGVAGRGGEDPESGAVGLDGAVAAGGGGHGLESAQASPIARRRGDGPACPFQAVMPRPGGSRRGWREQRSRGGAGPLGKSRRDSWGLKARARSSRALCGEVSRRWVAGYGSSRVEGC